MKKLTLIPLLLFAFFFANEKELALSNIQNYKTAVAAAESDEAKALATMEIIRNYFFLSVFEKKYIPICRNYLDKNAQLFSSLEHDFYSTSIPAFDAALTGLDAKHALWPQTKWSLLQKCLKELDIQAGKNPAHSETLYLRLSTTIFIPDFLGLSKNVDDDLKSLLKLLPAQKQYYAPENYKNILSFVRENAEKAGL